MLHRAAIAATIFAILATALLTPTLARALDDPQKYPNWKGQWTRAPSGVAGQPQPPFDPSKPWGLGQNPPLPPEYQALYEAQLPDQAAGGPGINGPSCRSHGMPMMMNVLAPMEIVVL